MVLVLGHRANTVRWVRRLLGEGADGVEVDVRLCGGVVCAGHGGGVGDAPGLLRLRLARLLEGLHFTPSVPLGRLLRAVPGWAVVMLDLKEPVPPVGALVGAVEAGGRRPLGVLVSTRRLELASGLAAAGFGVYASLDHRPLPGELEALAAAGFAGVSLRSVYVDGGVSAEARGLGLGVAAWTVNSVSEAARLRGLVDIVVTDRPRLVSGVLRGRPPRG